MDIPEELYEYNLFTCDYGEPSNRNHKLMGSFNSRKEAEHFAAEILGLNLRNENYEFEISRALSNSKILEMYKELAKYRSGKN